MKNMSPDSRTHPLNCLRLRDDKQPVWLDEYRSKNGYEGARKALTGLSPDEIVNQVKDAGLKGRGGAGFSTGLKCSWMPKDESMNIRYLRRNADEMEPVPIKTAVDATAAPAGEDAHLRVCAESLPWLHLPAWRYIEAAVNWTPSPKRLKRGCSAKTLWGNRFHFQLFVHTGQGATSAA